MANPHADVDHFLTILEHPLKEVIVQLRSVILSADAQITEHIKWKAPSFCYHGDDRVTMGLYPPDRIQLVFHRGVKVKDATTFVFADRSGLLSWRARDRATATFRSVQEVEEQQAALVELVQRWMRATT